MADELNFLKHIQANPADRVARLAYADWLEEQGDELSLLKADYLRTDEAFHELPEENTEERNVHTLYLREIANGLPVEFKATVARVQLEQPDFVGWAFQCPQKWEKLTGTSIPDVRYCDVCNSNVVYCSTLATAQEQSAAGRCVAVDLQVRRSEGDLLPPIDYRPLVMMGIAIPENWREPEYRSPPESDSENPWPDNTWSGQ